ncbi:MAG: B12-binding domain-containing radical SAM protein [Candidatus Saccharimonadales bacterium]
MKYLWLDLGTLGSFQNRGAELWQDHGLGLLRTIMHQQGVMTDILSLRSLQEWEDLSKAITGYDMLFMNVRSYTFPFACQAAQIFKQANPKGLVAVGGMHATVASDEMIVVEDFDYICLGPGENIIVQLARNPGAFPRIIEGVGASGMGDWPMIDRTLWPNPQRPDYPWPLEPDIGFGPTPVATIVTSRVCPFRCSFCNEASFIPAMKRKPVEQVIDELNFLDRTYGPLGSVVIHDSMFFQNPSWIEEWIEKYPSRANKVWPYWAAARTDAVRKWPHLFEALIRETRWSTISLGFESGSDRTLRTLNKECTVEDNAYTIGLLNVIGDQMEQEGKVPPKIFANLIFGTPGESHEEAMDTMRMFYSMKRAICSPAYFAPYPGSALGNQLIAEGKSLMTKANYHRSAGDRKLKGVDYDFYEKLLCGEMVNEIFAGLNAWQVQNTRNMSPKHFNTSHNFYLFGTVNGKLCLVYGNSQEDAWDVLKIRLTDNELAQINYDNCQKILQKDLQKYASQLA